MRLRTLLATIALAAVAATSAHASARPVTAQDRALLARAATYEEKIAEQVTARLTGRKASVRCGSLGMSDPRVLGVTPLLDQQSFDYFLMRPAECTYLAWFRQAPARWDPRSCAGEDCARVGDVAMALAVVAHESYHVLGYTNEAQVECYGMQSIWFVANKLGAPVAEAQALGLLYATRMYPNRQTQTPTYWSAECRDGGKYDLRPASHSWPS
ncbi:MAG: hypothetical protein JWM06_3449 [Actinomycetia bacterium]|nr:hypothetical protein [Actinomycetes bacterium]